jgi:serpin B
MATIARYTRALAAAFAMVGAMAARPAAAQLNIAAEARVTLLARAYNAAGQQLFGQLAAAPGNVVFSPYSVGTALSMAISGARGDTASEMMRALSMRMAPEAIDAANAELLSILNGYDQGSPPPACPPQASANGGNCETRSDARPGGELMSQCPPGLRLVGNRCVGPAMPRASAKILTANALMLHRFGDLISADYTAAVKNKYAAEIFRHAGLDDVNGWVARKTEGRIPRLLDALDPDATATLLNAIYFKTRWASVFDDHATRNESFHLNRAQKADVAFMNLTDRFSLVSRGGYKAVRLNYEVRELGFVIVLPDDIEGAGTVARRLGANELAELFAALRDGQARKPVALALPKFRIDFKAGLVPPLQQAGIRKAFDRDAADFSGMTGRPPTGDERIFIGGIVHRAVIDVAENGTEAAAATAVVAVAAAAAQRDPPPPPEVFRADHPFLFYLIDDTTGVILFQGRVADPRG